MNFSLISSRIFSNRVSADEPDRLFPCFSNGILLSQDAKNSALDRGVPYSERPSITRLLFVTEVNLRAVPRAGLKTLFEVKLVEDWASRIHLLFRISPGTASHEIHEIIHDYQLQCHFFAIKALCAEASSRRFFTSVPGKLRSLLATCITVFSRRF